MRKVTGYIGALIVVVALMGSILAGYALNVNGQSVVVNEYENVTDVSGLYSHTDEKTYIDYNPASNYIGYEIDQSDSFTIDNPNGMKAGLKYKLYTTSHSGEWTDSQYSDGAFYNNGNVVINSTTGDQVGITIYRVAFGENFTAYSYAPDGTNPGIEIRTYNNGTLLDRYWPTQATFNFNGSNVAITFNGNTINSPSSWIIMPANDGDYVAINNNGIGYYQSGQMYTQPEVTPVVTPIYEWDGEPTYNFYSVTSSSTPSNYFVPAVFTYSPVDVGNGIDYTESNRVNNYPIEYIYQENTEIQTLPQIDLLSISATSYFPYGYSWVIHENITRNMTFVYDGTTFSQWQGVNLATDQAGTPDNMKYRLSDIIATMDVPVGTSQLIFDTGTYVGRELILSDTISGVTSTGLYIPSNMVAIGTESYINGNTRMTGSDYGTKAFYTISTGLVDTYNRDGVKLSTSSLNDTYVQFYDEPNLTGDGFYQKALDPYGINRTVNIVFHWTASPGNSANNPYLNVTAVTNGAVENIKYLDVTKGIKIDPANTSDVIWNNEYENGNIQLLFRADDVGGIYHNDLEVSGNSISVDYGDSRFSVTLNGGEPVNIGTWRSIILDIDLENGDLYAIPVRTFNSFTNVQMDNTSLFIGSMTDYATTNTIEWNPTPNSLTFSVYNTSVFMNTYGVVMVDPSLTVTEYFTDLNNFYRLELTNFSIYGDSMTINGEVGEVTGNRITFGDESLIIKKLYITYADGNVYLSDGSTNIDLGEITSNNIIFGGAWYFKTFLQKGHTAQKQVYTWDWQNFILDNTEFCVIYIGLVLAGLVVARRFCTFTIMDYVVMGISLIIALGVQVIA